jgi:hypothetical protein
MKIDVAQLESALSQIDQKTVVVTFVDKSYTNIFEIFCQFWQKLNINNLLVVCLDEKSIQTTKRYSLNYFHVPYTIKSRYNFWTFRLNTLNEIFKLAKKTVIHTDSDCFWINNIIPHLDEYKNIDIHYSTGKGFPLSIVERYGFTLCCGFYCIKYNKNTCNFFDSILLEPKKDDQIATNEWVFRNAIDIIDVPSSFDSLHFKYIKLPNLNIAGIKQTAITRWRDCPIEVLKTHFCCHPYLTGTNEEKFEQLHHLRLIL